MKTIVLASHNPVKAEAALHGFLRMFPGQTFQLEVVSVPSQVRAQPLSNRETLQGAQHRANNAKAQIPGGDYWVGIEGGVEELEGEMSAFAWVVIISGDREGKGRTGTFFLPPAVATLIRQGKELGEADDLIFNQANSKQNNGAIGLLTGNALKRAELYEQAVILALVPLRNQELFLGQE